MRDLRAFLVLSVVGLAAFCSGFAQQPAAHDTAPANATPTFRAETRLVLVDTVVTDKSGHYLSDLTQNDFKVLEDGKEQPITSFSLEQGDTKPAIAKRQYMVLFFDNSNMQMGDQNKARDAAMKFIIANANPNRLIAVVDFGGTLRISQNFTADASLLKAAVKTYQSSFVSGNVQTDSAPSAALTQLAADFGTHTALLALGRVAQGLATVPGRKSLVLLTSGFPLDSQVSAEVTSVISICNRANVAVYPIDVRGLTVPDLPLQSGSLTLPSEVQPHLQLASFIQPLPNIFAQKGGTGGGGTHGAPGGTPSGGYHGGASSGGYGGGGIGPSFGRNNYNPYGGQAGMPPKVIVPGFPKSASDNQQVMYQLADGTGGFVIVNSNDLLGGLQRIAAEQSQYYLLGYKPPDSNDGSCHTIKVKVGRSGAIVRARSGYCNLKPLNFLAGTLTEKQLENHANAPAADDTKAAMQAPFFYVSPNVARVDLAVDIPSSALNLASDKAKQHATLNILGIAYKPDGSVAARFSDAKNFDFEDKKQVEEFQKQPFHYETQFELASGKYKVTVVFSSNEQSFGKLEMPLAIDPYSEKQFSLSGVALSNDIREISAEAVSLDSALLEDKTPLIVQGLQFMPSACNRFKTTDVAAIYAEIYEPLLKGSNPPEVAYELFVHERKTGAEKVHVGEKITKITAGNPVIPFGVRIPVDKLGPGDYRAELTAVDSAGNWSTTRVAEFRVE